MEEPEVHDLKTRWFPDSHVRVQNNYCINSCPIVLDKTTQITKLHEANNTVMILKCNVSKSMLLNNYFVMLICLN